MNPTLIAALSLLILASSAPSAPTLQAQSRSTKNRPRPVKVVPQRVEKRSQATSNSNECADANDTQPRSLAPEQERPGASFCFSAADLTCPGCKRGKEISAPQPCYPAIARAARVSGQVTVEIVIDESGEVVWARVVKGHPLLHLAALKAARQRTFEPYTCSGRALKVVELVVYDFKLS